MAFVSRGWRVSLTVADTEGSTTTLQYQCDAGVDTLAEAQALQNLLVAMWPSLSASVVKSYWVSEVFEDNAFALPVAAEIEKRAIITAKLATTFPKFANLIIPAPIQAIFEAATGPDAKVVDIQNADVQDFLELFYVNPGFTISDGEKLANPATAGNAYGHKAHRRSKRG